MVRVCLFLFFVLVDKKLGNVAYGRWEVCEHDYLNFFVLISNRIFSPADNLYSLLFPLEVILVN